MFTGCFSKRKFLTFLFLLGTYGRNSVRPTTMSRTHLSARVPATLSIFRPSSFILPALRRIAATLSKRPLETVRPTHPQAYGSAR